MILLTKIKWYDETGTFLIEEDLSDAIEWNVDSALELKNNKAVLNFINSWETASRHKYVDSNGKIRFREGQILKIYAKHSYNASDVIDESPNSTDLLMTVDITEFSPVHSESKETIKVVGVDKSFTMLNKIWSEAIPLSNNKTAPEIIKDIIRNTSQSVKGDGSWSVKASLETDSPPGYITAKRRTVNERGGVNTDTAFPVVSYQNLFKPLYEWLKDLSQIEYTNTDSELSSGTLVYGRPFIFYIDENNNFHWFYPNDNVASTFTVGTDIIYNVNMTKKVFDVTNMIIFGAGEDMNGVQITGYVFDETSDAKTLKMRWQPMENIAKTLIKEDYDKNPNRNSGKDPQYPSSYPVTPFWTDTAVNDDDEYNDSLWDAAIKEGERTARRILSGTSHARWKGSIELLGHRYTAGELVEFTDTNLGLNQEKLRIMAVRHSFRKSGWVTSLELEQDMKALGTM